MKKKKPKDIVTVANVDSTRRSIVVNFELLNPDDYISVGVLFTGQLTKGEAHARVKGIKDIVYQQITNKKSFVSPIIVLMSIVLLTVLLKFVEREKRLSKTALLKFERAKGVENSLDELQKEVPLLFSHLHEDTVSEVSSKVESIYSNEGIQNKGSESRIFIENELKKNIKLNHRADLIGKTIRLVGIIYLIFWIFTSDIGAIIQLSDNW